MASLYPVTIVLDRYQGCYSLGCWVAYNCDPEEVPDEASADDATCRGFWDTAQRARVGLGADPAAALADLARKVAGPCQRGGARASAPA